MYGKSHVAPHSPDTQAKSILYDMMQLSSQNNISQYVSCVALFKILRLCAELPEPVWAAALAANWDRKVKDLVDDIYGDHRYMVGCTEFSVGFLHCQLDAVQMPHALPHALLYAAHIACSMFPTLPPEAVSV